MAATQAKRRKKKKKKANLPLIITLAVLTAVIAVIVTIYIIGRVKYSSRFLPNTYINDINVSEKTVDEVYDLLKHPEDGGSFVIIRQDGTEVEIPFSDVGYKYDTKEKIQELFDRQSAGAWFMGYAGKADYSFTDSSSYDKDKLAAAIDSADWGSTPTKNAEIVKQDDGTYVVNEAVQGDDMDKSVLKDYLMARFAAGSFYVKAEDSGCYIKPTVIGAELEQKCEQLNKVGSLRIVYDFDYTTETLEGERLESMITMDEDKLTITADRDKCMAYIDELAAKYDTYDTERKFHATLQGDIIVPTSDDAKYGWWIYKDATCDKLVEMLENCDIPEGKIKPIYYEQYGYTYTGLPSARTADDDIGDTYCEIDLTAQHFWYYEKGEMKYECDIVSGQTTSQARTTLPGVYKLWNKQTNYRMKATNADGESWDSTCNYWNNVSICGIGMHDTVRRYAFGGNIYKYNGSHGCINMPLNAAKYVYDNVALETPVVMYYKSADKQ
ncbi:MAG: peptidoglycan binding domain-containing protein [Ruminococcus sp.]|nr:peptidoglycan binding domain-containing protein [Ruminococcus sp.]